MHALLFGGLQLVSSRIGLDQEYLGRKPFSPGGACYLDVLQVIHDACEAQVITSFLKKKERALCVLGTEGP
jgi:hypothetical protein